MKNGNNLKTILDYKTLDFFKNLYDIKHLPALLFISVLPFGLIVFSNKEINYTFSVFTILVVILVLLYLHDLKFEKEELFFYILIYIGAYIISIFPFSITLQGVCIISVPFIFIAYLILKFDFKKFFIFQFEKRRDIKYFILFIIPFIFSNLYFNFKDFVSFSGFFKILYFLIAGLFFTIKIPKIFFSDIKKLERFFKLLIYSGFIISIAGIYSCLIPSFLTTKVGFATGLFVNANTNAFFTSFCIPITLYYILFKRNYQKFNIIKIKYILIFIVLIFNMFLSYSRAGYIGSGISILIILFLYSKKIFIFTIPFIIYSLLNIIPLMSLKSSSTLARVGLLYAAIEMLKSSNEGFLWGFGTISVFTKYEIFKASISSFFDIVNYPHNFVLFFIMQFGIIPFIPLSIYFIVYLVKSIKYLLKRKNNQNSVFIILFSIFVSIMVQSLFEDTILFPHYFVFPLFLVFFGLTRLYIINDVKV